MFLPNTFCGKEGTRPISADAGTLKAGRSPEVGRGPHSWSGATPASVINLLIFLMTAGG